MDILTKPFKDKRILQCVCVYLNISVSTRNWHLWGPNACPQEFEGIFEAENVILELQLGYG